MIFKKQILCINENPMVNSSKMANSNSHKLITLFKYFLKKESSLFFSSNLMMVDLVTKRIAQDKLVS